MCLFVFVFHTQREISMLALLTVGAALVLKTSATPKPKLHAAAIRALPGDPSLVLHTSANLGDNKVTFMKACWCSNAIATTLSKPESYVRGQGWLRTTSKLVSRESLNQVVRLSRPPVF